MSSSTNVFRKFFWLIFIRLWICWRNYCYCWTIYYYYCKCFFCSCLYLPWKRFPYCCYCCCFCCCASVCTILEWQDTTGSCNAGHWHSMLSFASFILTISPFYSASSLFWLLFSDILWIGGTTPTHRTPLPTPLEQLVCVLAKLTATAGSRNPDFLQISLGIPLCHVRRHFIPLVFLLTFLPPRLLWGASISHFGELSCDYPLLREATPQDTKETNQSREANQRRIPPSHIINCRRLLTFPSNFLILL